MIRKWTVKRFKRFASQDFSLAQLTVLAGLNGSGKTSVIHSLLLAREASLGRGEDPVVQLNGPHDLELGTAEGVLNWDAEGKICFLAIDSDSNNYSWTLEPRDAGALHLHVTERPAKPPVAFSAGPRTFAYLAAERLGPRSTLGAAALPAEWLEVGTHGEYSAQVLAEIGSRPLEWTNRRHPKADPELAPLLKYETECWLSEIVRPVEVDAETFTGTAVTALRFRAPGGVWVRAPNMGFGVSYALPVILAGLLTAPGGMLVVENPEAHLHPAGQSAMGGFFARIAAAGVQVVVETHSDHVLNGVRRAIGEGRILPADEAIVHFFDSNGAQTLSFTETGGVSHWPRGFFDQYQFDVAALTRVRRPR